MDQRDSLNKTLNNLKNEFNQYKNSSNLNQTNYNNTNSNYNNNNSYYQNAAQHTNTYSDSKKSKYYNVATGQPVSAFEYYKYKIKQFFSNLFLIILSIIAGILIFNTFSNSNLFDYLNLF